MKLFIEKFDTVNDLIDFSEDRFNSDIQDIVSDVINKNKRIVLLTGPSGSGKTTSAKKIVREIKRRGVEAVYLSMDNWFRTKSEFDIPSTEDGGFDYESPLCVNIELLTFIIDTWRQMWYSSFKNFLKIIAPIRRLLMRQYHFTTSAAYYYSTCSNN